MKNKNNLQIKFGMIFLLGVMLLGSVSAIAVSIPHMEEVNGIKTYEVYENNVEDFKVVLQTSGEDPINVKVEILQGSNVIELMETESVFLVNPGEKVPIQFRIVSPPGANIGDKFPISLSFSSSEVGEGALAFGTAIEQRFDLVLVEMPQPAVTVQEEPKGNAALIFSIAIVVLLVLVVIVLKVKKGKKPEAPKKEPVKKKK